MPLPALAALVPQALKLGGPLMELAPGAQAIKGLLQKPDSQDGAADTV